MSVDTSSNSTQCVVVLSSCHARTSGWICVGVTVICFGVHTQPWLRSYHIGGSPNSVVESLVRSCGRSTASASGSSCASSCSALTPCSCTASGRLSGGRSALKDTTHTRLVAGQMFVQHILTPLLAKDYNICAWYGS